MEQDKKMRCNEVIFKLQGNAHEQSIEFSDSSKTREEHCQNAVVHIQKEYGIKDASKIAIKNIKTIKEGTTSTGINF